MVDLMSSMDSGFDQQKAEAFAGRLLTALNDGALSLSRSTSSRRSTPFTIKASREIC